MHNNTSQEIDDQHTCAPCHHTVTDFWHAINHDEELIKDQLNVYLFIFLYQYYLGIHAIIHRYNLELENYNINLKNQHNQKVENDQMGDTPVLMDSISEDDDDDDEIDVVINKSLPKGKKRQQLKPPKQPQLMFYYLHRWLRVVLDIEPQISCRDLFDESLKSLTNSEQLLKEKAKLQANFSVSLQEHAINLLTQQPTKKDQQTEDQLRLLNEELAETTDEITKIEIEQKIIKLLEDSLIIPKNKVESILNLLNLLIQKGNQDQYWDLCLVNGVVLSDREQHPLAEDHQWRKLLDVEQFEHLLQAQLVTRWHDPLFLAEVIKFSLMVDCYIVDTKLYDRVVEALNQQYFCSLNDLVYVDVQIDTMNPPRKVFISPLTRVYLQQYYKVFGGHNSALPLNSHAFNDELYQLLGVAKSRYPRSDRMSGWFKRVKSYLLFVKGIPGILLYYLTNYGSSYSLKEHKFDQLFSPTSWQSQFTQSSAPMEGDGNEATYVAVTRIVNPPAWSQVLSVLNVAHISDSQKQRVQSEITEQLTHIRHQGLLNENEQLLLDWAIYLLGKSAAPSSVRKRLFAIGQRLVALAEGCVIAKKPIDNGGVATVQTKKHLSPEDRLELYRDCLELSVSHQNHENMRGYLHAFEVWLCTECKALPIPYDEEFNLDVNSSKHRVNASLILVDDYQFLFDTLFTLSRNTANEDFSYMLLVLILGFRLGLRRDEIAGLKLDDYLASDHDPFLLLRTSEARSLKTTNAQRYFRLSDHMPKHEWELFNKHYQAIIEHKDEKNKRGRIKYLFPKIERIDTKMN
ncbi:MAG: hypothetical protein JHC38_06495, partial [Thiotrichales bacterium]|nr:hypothetical protein [Thiotrichales bacterium]